MYKYLYIINYFKIRNKKYLMPKHLYSTQKLYLNYFKPFYILEIKNAYKYQLN